MKKSIILLMLIPFGLLSFANKKKVESKISDVTVYLSGAEITRKAKTNLSTGTTELIFINLPVSLDSKSIQVNVPENIKILSVLHRINNNETGNIFSGRKMLREEINKRDFEIERINAMLTVYDEKKKLLLGNSDFSSQNSGVNLEELKQAATYFSRQLEDIEIKKLSFKKQKAGLKHEIDSIRKEIARLINIKPEPTGEVVVKVDSKRTGSAVITIKYFVGAAGWTPAYDIRVKDVNRPLILSVKADVNQSTGEDWKDVKLTLSTDSPKKDNRKPTLAAWYPDFRNYGYSRNRGYEFYSGSGAGALKGRVVDNETGQEIAFANIIIEKNGRQIARTTSDFDGNFVIRAVPPDNYDLKVQYLGYKTLEVNNLTINPDQVTFYDLALEASATALEEVTITAYKVPLISKDNTISGGTFTADQISRMPARSAYSADNSSRNVRGTRVDGMRVHRSASIPDVAIKQYRISNIRYEIDNPYTIPSDGDSYTVSVKDYEVDVNYEYYAVPKLDEDAFLLARITGWEEMNLLPGKSNIFFKGTYTGKTFINPDITEDTLDLSIGRDKGIVVTRKRIKDFKSRQTIGSNIKEFAGFEISVRNTKNSEISITVADQFPLTRTKDMSVDRIDYSGGELNDDTGKVVWKMKISPQKTEKRELKYSVKYPKGKSIVLE